MLQQQRQVPAISECGAHTPTLLTSRRPSAAPTSEDSTAYAHAQEDARGASAGGNGSAGLPQGAGLPGADRKKVRCLVVRREAGYVRGSTAVYQTGRQLMQCQVLTCEDVVYLMERNLATSLSSLSSSHPRGLATACNHAASNRATS